MRKLFLSLAIIGITSAIAIGATTAYFSDTETSSANTFTAGTLDLKLNGGDVDVHVSYGMQPVHSQPNFGYLLKNTGSLTGHLTLNNIVVSDAENGCNEPEISAGDITCTETDGELSKALNLVMWMDTNKDGWISTGEVKVYDGPMYGLPSTLDLGKNLTANEETRLGVIINWWSNNYILDNLTQSDSSVLDMDFTLTQI